MSITVTGPNTRHAGRINGTRQNGIPLENFSNNYAWNGIRLFNDPIYSIRNPAEIPIVPAMSGIPLLEGNNSNASINGIIISDSGESGIASTTMTVTSNPAGVGGTPVWNGNSITGIDLNGLTANNHFIQFEFSIVDRADNNVIYRIRLTRNAAGDFNFGNPMIVLQNSSSSVITSDTLGHHGANATAGLLRTPSFWIGLGYIAANGWDTSTVGSRGYPRLARLGGQ